jgi:dUTP pyrophosphatase
MTTFMDIHKEFAYLKIYVDPEYPKLKELYQEHVDKHNDSLNTPFANSGFDLLVPDELICPGANSGKVTMAKLKIQAEMLSVGNLKFPSAYFLMPRSSIAKTPLMQANHVGLIDSGYRGEIMGALRNLSADDYKIEQYTRLFQLCHPATLPIHVEIVDNLDDLSSTERGSGGFGSTGSIGSLQIS